MRQAIIGAQIFDGQRLHTDAVLVVDGDRVAEIGHSVPKGAQEIRLAGGFLLPGLIDLQVNGGGGFMVDGQTSASTLAAICAIHARQGATGILPTLITDTPDATDHVIAAAKAAKGSPGFLGLHLEGPHLDPRRKGAHDPALIRPMEDADLSRLLRAADQLPALMVTVAPSAVTASQIAALAERGVVVSLGHSDCTGAEAQAAIGAGASCATHLFNAMSQIGNREPGLAGTVLSQGIACGLIADGIHVHPDVMRLALAAKPDAVFLVSDCMAAAGTDQQEFTLNGRRILRQGGRLTLEDGTLAGADLTLPRAIKVLVDAVGITPERAFAMACRIPADVIGRNDIGRIAPGLRADLVSLSSDFALNGVWQAGVRLS